MVSFVVKLGLGAIGCAADFDSEGSGFESQSPIQRDRCIVLYGLFYYWSNGFEGGEHFLGVFVSEQAAIDAWITLKKSCDAFDYVENDLCEFRIREVHIGMTYR